MNGLLIVANWPSDVGYAWWFMERIWVELANRQAAAGGTTHIIFPEVRGVSRTLADLPAVVHELDFSERTPANRKRLRKLIAQHDIRAVYLTDRASLDPWYALMRIWGIRVIVNNDQTPGDRDTSRFKRVAKSSLHRLRLFSPDLSVAPSGFVLDRFTRIYGLPAGRCRLIPNGVEPIEISNFDPGYVHREFGLPDDAVVVVSLSRAVEYKGIPLIIACADRLINDEGRRDLYFVHCGDGPDIDAFRARVAELGLTKHFLLPGARPDYHSILPSCDIALHASKGEGFSLAILECMSAALPILVPDNSGNREAVDHGVSGFCYEAGSVDAILAALRDLLDNADLRQRVGSAAREAVLQRFTLQRTLNRFATEVSPLLAGAQPSVV